MSVLRFWKRYSSQFLLLVIGVVAVEFGKEAFNVFESFSLASVGLLPLFSLECESSDSCGSCSSCSASGGASDTYSTAFLYTRGKDGFTFENDFLFGKPSSYYRTVETGKQAYERGAIKPDLYRVRSEIVSDVAGEISFQIREVEPEEDYFDHMSLTRVIYPLSAELVIDAGFDRFIALDKESVLAGRGVNSVRITGSSGKVLQNNILDTQRALNTDDPVGFEILDRGEYLEIEADIKDLEDELLLLVRSYFRDYTRGSLLPATKKDSFVFSDFLMNSVQRVSSLVPLPVLIGMLGVVGVFAPMPDFKDPLSAVVTRVLADAPPDGGPGGRSLHVSYWDGAQYRYIETVQPRFRRFTLEAVKIPNVAVQNGKIRLRIDSTRRHYVDFIGLSRPKQPLAIQTETFPVARAYHRRLKSDFADILNTPNSGQYLRTVPADIVDVTFEVPDRVHEDGMQTAFLIHAGGFYIPLSEEGQKLAGHGWIDRLDPEAREFLRGLYVLEDYDKSDRKPVLS